MNDQDIIALFLCRNEEALSRTAERYGKLLLSVAMGILADRSDSEECVNDALLRAWERIPPDEPRNFRVYLCRILRNLAIDRSRAERSGKRGGGEFPLPLDELSEILCDGGTDGPEAAADGTALSDLISRWLTEQTPDTRAVFVHRYFYCMSMEETASACAFSVAKCKSILYRSRLSLKETLMKEGFDL